MIFLVSIISLMLLGCAASSPKISIYDSLDSVDCPNATDFKGTAVSLSEQEALDMARLVISKNIQSRLDASNESFRKQIGDKLTESIWQQQISQTSSLQNAQDAKLHKTERRKDSVGVVVCMSRADAAKGFAERQRLVADSLELVSRVLPSITHPKQKNEAWSRTQTLWNEFSRLQVMLDGFGVARADLFNSVSEMHSKTREDYKNYCRNVKLHWNVKQGNEYSEIAFSVLSKKLKMEKSMCQGDGISLAYKNDEPDCSPKFGLHTCSGKIALSVASCEGAEYLLLESVIDGAHQKPDFALERMQNRLRTADFWDKWIQEIQLWRPLCE